MFYWRRYDVSNLPVTLFIFDLLLYGPNLHIHCIIQEGTIQYLAPDVPYSLGRKSLYDGTVRHLRTVHVLKKLERHFEYWDQ